MTEQGIDCFKVMSFRLKNTGTIYQRLINKMFKDLIGDIIEVYIDDMCVKSKKKKSHIEHLTRVFAILRKFRIKLNPAKCVFGVSSGKFLGHVVSKRGIEPYPMQIKNLMKEHEPGQSRTYNPSSVNNGFKSFHSSYI